MAQVNPPKFDDSSHDRVSNPQAQKNSQSFRFDHHAMAAHEAVLMHNKPRKFSGCPPVGHEPGVLRTFD